MKEEKVELFSQVSAAESLGLGKKHPAGPASEMHITEVQVY